MTGQAFDVVPEDLTAHASHLDGLTDRLSQALDAANTVSMNDEAYGILCSFLPLIINPLEEKAIQALKDAVDGVTTTADNVRITANQYRDTDDTNAAPFDQTLR
jgi:excreted virulence factor EspC (type VII ESX diderm)